MVRSTAFLLASIVMTTAAWGPMKLNSHNNKIHEDRVKNFVTTIASAGVAATIVLGTAIGNPNIASATDFTGSFSDPKHPSCTRLVAVEGTDALVSGTDGTPRCEGGEGKPWKLIGNVDGDKIFVDFSPNGGPKDLKGVWVEGKSPGIRWPDGNKWTLEARP